MKKELLILVFFVCIIFVSASDSFEFKLDKTTYSSSQNFQGSLVFQIENVALSKLVKADVLECGSYDEKEISLYDLLLKSGVYSGPTNEYSLGNPSTIFQKTLEINGSSLMGLFVGGEVDNLNFSVSGSGYGLYFDVGDDGSNDWHYLGNQINWSGDIYSEEYQSTYSLDSVTDFNPRYAACNNFEVDFDELNQNLKVKIFATAKKTTGDGELYAEIGSKRCNLTQGITNYWGEVSCELELDVSRLESPNNFYVCVQSTKDGYWLPRPAGSNYFFFNLKKAKYDEFLKQNKVYFSDLNLVKAINQYTNDCNSGNCVVPIRVNLIGGGTLSLADLILEYDQTRAYDFYELDSSSIIYNMSNVSVSLDYFSDLKTPEVDEKKDCILKIDFEGDEYEQSFQVSPGPVAVISVSSSYIGKDMKLIFDGSNSFSKENASIDKWTWDFGSNKTRYGEIVEYSFSQEGNYSINLTVEDSKGMESKDTQLIQVVSVEEYLNREFERVDGIFDESLNNIESLTGEAKEFSLFMKYPSLIIANEELVEELKENFTGSLSNNNSLKVANELNEILINTPLNIEQIKKRSVDKLPLTNPNQIVKLGVLNSSSNFDKYAIALYNFNIENVDVNMDSILFNVDFISGESGYLYVQKKISVNGGANKKIVEDLRNVVSSLDNVFSDAQKDTQNNAIYWLLDSGNKEIKYVLKSNLIEQEIRTIIYSDVDLEGINLFYCYDFSSGCERYCGDGHCDVIPYMDVDEKDSTNQNYCAKDCVREDSIFKYILVFVLFFVLVIYLFIYKGPGNFKQVVNKISYGIIHKKLFVSDKDRNVLINFISNALRRGYKKEEVIAVLLKKGWQQKQIAHIFENYINKNE